MESPARVGRYRNRLARRLTLAAKIAWLLSIAGTVLFFAPNMYLDWASTVLGAMGILGLAGLVAMASSWLMSLFSGSTAGFVTVHEGKLQLKQGRHPVTIPIADVTSAHAQIGSIVEITTKSDDTWVVDVKDDEDAAQLVSELGFSHGEKPVAYRLGNRFRRFLHFAVAFMAYQVGGLIGGLSAMAIGMLVDRFGPPHEAGFLMAPMFALAMFAFFIAGKRLIRAPVVTVGNDGVWIETLGFRKRFIPIAEIVMAHQPALGAPVRLKLRDGSVVHMTGFIVDPARRDAAAAHIRALLAKHAAMQKTSGVLAREGRSVREWREHLRRLFEGGGYRIASANESLDDLVVAPGISAEERIGAALALRAAGTNAPRIRIAAEHCVDPKTRAALEAAAQDEIDEQAIEKALR